MQRHCPASEKPLDLDDLLPHVGEFGRYQKCLLWLVCLPACIPCGFCAFNQLFMAESPDHWCRIPTLEQFISDPEARRAIGIPLQGESNSTYEKCIRYAVNWTELIQSNNISELSSVANSSWPTEYCRDGWEFDLSDISSSIVIDFELVCQRDIYPTIGLAGLNLGGPFGVYFFGLINDRMMMHRTLSEEKKMKEGPGITALFRTPNMRLKTLLITLNWFANETVYVGLSYYGPALGSDRYLSFFLSSAVEIPSYLSCWMIMDHWGRRWPLAISMVISGISCVATVLLPADEVDLILILFLFSKFAISASFLIIYPFAGELYPTEIRGLGIGMSAYVGGLGLIIIPFITYLGQESLVLPLLILGLLSVVGGFSSLRLPETLHHRLPQTVEEGEQFGKNWTMADCCRCVPIRPEPETSTYEDLDELGALEMNLAQPAATELTSLNSSIKKPRAIPRLVRQASVLETPVDSSGTMKMTYWF
ncbi:unnamed protein product [Nesidiocoris tenuis]|uniref:Major facilitator superfamily (MFS) profile domain-containing protein n=1 Tax=Nesidiocoris tenuis TaxID=355587 RepID=A0A6H5HMU8_9HEMI|nr:unnamed protein product [Nesidiocoris tenuis]